MSAPPEPRALRVLHVDDDPVTLLVMDHMLESLGHRPQRAATAAEALTRLEREAFDVVLTDIHMPGVDGVALLQRLQGAAHRDLPVVAITADVMTRTAEDFRRLGFAGAIGKPILVEGLQAALANAVLPPPQRGFASRGLARG